MNDKRNHPGRAVIAALVAGQCPGVSAIPLATLGYTKCLPMSAFSTPPDVSIGLMCIWHKELFSFYRKAVIKNNLEMTY